VPADKEEARYAARVARLRATARWRQQVAGLTDQQLFEFMGAAAAGPDTARSMVRVLAFLAELRARHPKFEEKKHDA
jgi:hypothetical protein